MSQVVALWIVGIVLVLLWVAYPALMWRLVCAAVRFTWEVVYGAFVLLLAWI